MQEVLEKKKSKYTAEMYEQWYEIMLRIRRFEEKTLLMYSLQKIRGILPCLYWTGSHSCRPDDCTEAGRLLSNRLSSAWTRSDERPLF